MDFFAQQDKAKKNTGVLLVYFSLAILLTVILVYFVPLAGLHVYLDQTSTPNEAQKLGWWYPDAFLGVCGVTLLVVLTGASLKIIELRRGGGKMVAEMLGGKEILPNTEDFFERRLRNVVEEMAIASGTPVPPVYVMPKERGINAFAAGFTVSDSVVAVTYGTMTGLTRDELQGVVAHEFSHILNNDMAMNIRLMGLLHGLLLIGLTGQILIRVGAGSGSSRDRDNKGGGLPIIGAGLALMIVGYAGVFFGKLIKASVSRSRERLADASAVQFTRNPTGLASALKKIGGLSAGSRIFSARAEEASHMFFGKGTRGSFFSTHPSLKERVRWLEPNFKGEFEKFTYEDLRANLEKYESAPKMTAAERPPNIVDMFTKPHKMAVAGAILDSVSTPPPPPPPRHKPNNPEALIDSIGKPMEHHADAAKRLIDSIPERVKDYARDPYGSRMLIYFLLLDTQADVLEKQMEIILRQAEPAVFETLQKALPQLGSIAPELRLPIVDLSIPALRFLAKGQYASFRSIVKQLIEADEKVDIFEYALQRVLTHHLDPMFNDEPKNRAVNYYAVSGLCAETSTVLSVLARNGHASDEQAAAAFNSAAAKITDPKAAFKLADAGQCSWDDLDAALDKLNQASFKVKKWVLGAALACLMNDREITVEEVELFRAVSDTLGCPVPPWVVPAGLDAA